MQRDKAYLLDILDAAKLAVEYVGNMSIDEFIEDIRCQDAVIRRLEIIGEAARRISDTTKSDHPEVPWFEMVGMRNVVIHEYDDVDIIVIWDTIKKDIPSLISAINKIIN